MVDTILISYYLYTIYIFSSERCTIFPYSLVFKNFTIVCYYVYLLYFGANCPGYYLQLSFVCVCVCVCLSFIPALHIDSDNPLPLFVLLLGFGFGLYFFF